MEGAVRQANTTLSISTTKPGLLEITDRIVAWTRAQAFATGF